MSDEEPLDEKRLWEQWGFESLEELGQFHKYEMARRRATRPIPTDEEAEHQHAEQPPKKAEGAAEPKNTERAVDPKKARKINTIQDPDSKKDDEFGKNEETSKGLDAGGNIDSATNE
ncbi:hypothetical protein V2G26_014630 [Clonostachys chloroleuca]|uniref:Uncharacterized protein n=1 Tax=Clonostachys chloroleuca TaxID=1926264 RepID=A0AA35MEC8_9HYPO|nr:unnamed protein product [Clonostachys chloroleuca]